MIGSYKQPPQKQWLLFWHANPKVKIAVIVPGGVFDAGIHGLHPAVFSSQSLQQAAGQAHASLFPKTIEYRCV